VDPVEQAASEIGSLYQRKLAQGEAVFEEGDPGGQLYVIQSGQVELIRRGRHGPCAVARLGPGELFGELGAVLGQRRTTRAVAVCETEVLALDRETLETMCLDQPQIAMRMLRVLATRLIEAEQRLAAMEMDDSVRALAQVLLRRAEPDPQRGARIVTNLRSLAAEAGLPMLEAHRALQQLFERKLVRLSEETLFARDLQALSAVLDARG
jgi:CRP/FNR family transcriptional regulator